MTIELEPRDRELAEALRATLERRAAQPDSLLDSALAATRAQIANSPAKPRHPWLLASGGFALAASLAVVVVLPFGQGPAPAVAEQAAMPDADLQLLEDMDLLVAMSETRHGG